MFIFVWLGGLFLLRVVVSVVITRSLPSAERPAAMAGAARPPVRKRRVPAVAPTVAIWRVWRSLVDFWEWWWWGRRGGGNGRRWYV